MRIDVLTIFPLMINFVLEYGVIGRAIKNKLLDINVHDLRDYASGNHRQVDDEPFGGGAGMVMKPEPFFKAVERISKSISKDYRQSRRIMLSPAGKLLDQKYAKDLSEAKWVFLLCGRYEGIDNRVEENLCTDVISIGDYVLSGGEIPSIVLIETMVRNIPGVLGCGKSADEDSFTEGLLDYPHYTRPKSYRGMDVPEVLLSGNHKDIDKWRKEQSIKITRKRRPDIML